MRRRTIRHRSPLHVLAALLGCILVTAVGQVSVAPPASAGPDTMWMPVQVSDEVHYSNTWGAPRSGGRRHQGVDIMAPQMHRVYAAEDGVIHAYKGACDVGERCYSYYLLISGDDGRSYFYVHLNNDTPGRPNGCDQTGGVDNAYSPRLVHEFRERGTLVGVRVRRGEHIGYVGSSGNASCGVDHIHYEIWNGHGWGSAKINPYHDTRAAQDAGRLTPYHPEPVPTSRARGADRLGTALDLSRQAYDTAPAVVLAPGSRFEEALVAAPLAATLGGPTLLADGGGATDVADDRLVAEINRLGAERLVVVGDEEAVRETLVADLVARTGVPAENVTRIAGEDRYELSSEVARLVLAARDVHPPAEDAETPEAQAGGGDGDGGEPELPLPGPDERDPSVQKSARRAETADGLSVLLALGERRDGGDAWPDGMVSSVLGARQLVPVLLTEPDRLSEDTAEILSWDGIGEVRIAGGTGAIAQAVEDEVRELGLRTRRLAGATRYETALAIAEELVTDSEVGADEVAVSTATNFPDAVASGPALASMGMPLLLVDGHGHRSQPTPVETWLRGFAEQTGEVRALGGRAAVGIAALDWIGVLSNWPR